MDRMIVEFERRITQLAETLKDREAGGLSDDAMTHRIRGQLEECEKLYAFYQAQLKSREVGGTDAT